jgi:arsenate reductase
MRRKPSVLFFSTGDATRSRMAAALLRLVTDELETASTAVKSVAAHTLAEEVMNEIGVDISTHPAKPVGESLREHFAVVVTLSDHSKERHPVWPFTRKLVHWNLPDPASVEGPLEDQREVFRRLRDELHYRTLELVASIQPARQEQKEAIAA